jgi:hypothetical protein
VPIVFSTGLVAGGVAIRVAVLTFVPFATLYEQGGNTIWPPAIVHFAAACIMPLAVLGLASPTVIVYWMGAQIVGCYAALFLVRWTERRPSLAGTTCSGRLRKQRRDRRPHRADVLRGGVRRTVRNT